MVKISIHYVGDLHCIATHGLSGRRLETDAPMDNHGRGESFSPTDLVATALGTCMATVMGIVAQRHGIDLKEMKLEITKEMTSEAPRRITKLSSHLWMPCSLATLSTEKRAMLEKAALSCPVHHSLRPEIEKPVVFHWTTDQSQNLS